MDFRLRGNDEMGKFCQLLTRFVAVSVLAGALCACSFMLEGHRLNPDKVSDIRLGSTTEQQVRQMFGEPEILTVKGAENIKVLTYKRFHHTGIFTPLPFLQVGKVADKGYTLNIMIKDGVVMNYEFAHAQERYLH